MEDSGLNTSAKEKLTMRRTATIHRKTNETDIRLRLNLDGRGKAHISTGIRFFDHMLELVARHGAFDLDVDARGDLDVDQHHTVEDVGITLGEAVQKALGSKRGILRAGYFLMPMTKHSLLPRWIWRKALLRRECEDRGKTRRRFPGRAGGGFLPRVRAIRKSQRSSALSLRPLLASSGRGHVQGVRTRLALRRSARQTPAAGFAQHKGTAMKLTIIDYGAGNVPSVERALQRLGAESERTSSPERISKAEALLLRAWDITPLWFAPSTSTICAHL